MIPSRISRAFRETEAYFAEVRERVSERLRPYCENEGFIFDDRIKALESVAEKIESGRYRSWSEIDDLYACTVAVPLLQDEQGVIDELGRLYDVKLVRGRHRNAKQPDRFAFDSTRVYASLRSVAGSDLGDKLFAAQFEIQVMSLFEFAWSRTTHAMTYKSDLLAWKRYRLAAHLKAAAEQADFLLLGFDQAADLVRESPWGDVDDRATIREAFVGYHADGLIPDELRPKDWSRFADNVYRVIQLTHDRKPSGFASSSLDRLGERLATIRTGLARQNESAVPRSVSLFQNVVGLLAEAGQIPESAKKRGYFAPITPELEDIFAGVEFPLKRFDFDA